MIQDSSREAYESILPELNDRQATILALLERSQPMTNSEIAQVVGWSINRVTPRVLELRTKGKVADFGVRVCRVTGRSAHQWSAVKPTLF